MKLKEKGPYNSLLNPFDRFGSFHPPKWLEHREQELESLMGAHPAGSKKHYKHHADVKLVHALVCVQSLIEGCFDSLIKYNSKFRVPSNMR